jgi:predicted dehydrogenase
MSARFRVGLIGTGMIANAAHLPAYRNLKDDVEIVGVADTRETAAKETAERYQIPRHYTDPYKMLQDLKPDLVSVTTPNAYHKEYTIAALKAGAHVLCEKPIAVKHRDAVEMYQVADSEGRLLFASQTLRFQNKYLAAKEFCSEGKLGEPYFVDIEMIRRRGIPTWGLFHIKEHNLGGSFCDLGVHALDCVTWLLDNPRISAVSGKAYTKIANRDEGLITSLADSGAPLGAFTPRPYDYREFSVEDFASCLIRYESGLTIAIKIAWAMNLADSGGIRIRIAGTKAGAELNPTRYFINQGSYQSELVPKVPPDRTVPFAGHWSMMEHILRVLKGKEERIVKPAEVLSVVSAIEAFYLSAELDEEVRMDRIVGKP